MRSFAVIAGLAASAQAAAVYGDYPAYNVSSAVETPVYEATASIPAYETSAPVYEVSTVHTVDCPRPTTVVVGSSSIVVESSTVITYTEVYETTKTPEAAEPTAHYSEAPPAPVHPTEHSEAPAPTHTPVPYPSSNGTHPTAVYPTASAPPTKPTSSTPAEFTGAASKATFGFLAIAGAVAALL